MKFHKRTDNILLAILLIIIIGIPFGLPKDILLTAFVIVIAYIIRNRKNKEQLQSIGLKNPTNLLKTILLAFLLGIIIELIIEIVFNPLFERMTGTAINLSDVDFNNSIIGYIIWVIVGFILAALPEEILFRGFILTRVSNLFDDIKVGNIIGLIVSSATFGLCHLYQGWAGVLSTGFIGFLLGIIFLQSNKNIWVCVLIHGFINFTGLSILYFGYYDHFRHLLFH